MLTILFVHLDYFLEILTTSYDIIIELGKVGRSSPTWTRELCQRVKVKVVDGVIDPIGDEDGNKGHHY